MLSPEDQAEFEELQKHVGSPENRYNRNKRLATLNESFDLIRQFCARGDEDDWKRYLVCGICWFPNGIAINTRQLRVLIAKSKSTINGAIAKMGYTTVPTKGDDATQLLNIIPYLKGHFSELRQWTIRRSATFMTPTPEVQVPTPAPVMNENPKNQISDIFQFDFTPYDFDEFADPAIEAQKDNTISYDDFLNDDFLIPSSIFNDTKLSYDDGKSQQIQFYDESSTIGF
ncbi:potassium/sodium hyperpolarization-activated cyclic nucleotide-gated channel 1 [Histomonas meleagridis]|uniref:potassium/sodium hyperpolarization-activated cyclic nucleotide-gated channel 1 n=1 Tax=Histomonas meleagridis TaxID=135588 RepID=UPI00355A61B8|nr:potassium/sodium hyperpolarization-activated cyclic nucleotide-gated channel 1 [Histomonas meleagridis]KAH0800229.1 potassium/sodium hyperpolarization-activated cyclic nucleotide-gated channel 1 [Histomonas meleagridis]